MSCGTSQLATVDWVNISTLVTLLSSTFHTERSEWEECSVWQTQFLTVGRQAIFRSRYDQLRHQLTSYSHGRGRENPGKHSQHAKIFGDHRRNWLREREREKNSIIFCFLIFAINFLQTLDCLNKMSGCMMKRPEGFVFEGNFDSDASDENKIVFSHHYSWKIFLWYFISLCLVLHHQ